MGSTSSTRNTSGATAAGPLPDSATDAKPGKRRTSHWSKNSKKHRHANHGFDAMIVVAGDDEEDGEDEADDIDKADDAGEPDPEARGLMDGADGDAETGDDGAGDDGDDGDDGGDKEAGQGDQEDEDTSGEEDHR